MPLSAEAKATNLEKSLTAWIQTQLVTGAGLTVFYGMAPITTRPNEWVHVDYLLGLRRDFGRQVDCTQLGNRVHGIVNLNLAKKRESITNLYALATMRDAVLPAFQVGQSIPVRNYDVGGTPDIGILVVESVNEADIDDGLNSGVMVKALSINVHYMEAYTLV